MSGLFAIPVQKSDLESRFWYDANFNPYGNPYVGDCVVRAVSCALMMKYRSVCRKLGIGLKVGFGAKTEGLSVMTLSEAFREYLRPVEGEPSGTVEDFLKSCGKASGQPYGIYVLCLPDHAVCACAVSESQKHFVDTWDSGKQPVQFALKVLKQVPKGSADRLTLPEFRRIQQEFSDPSVQARFAELAKKA